MESLSERYGWLPSEIRKEKYEDLVIYMEIGIVKSLLNKEKSKKYGRS